MHGSDLASDVQIEAIHCYLEQHFGPAETQYRGLDPRDQYCFIVNHERRLLHLRVTEEFIAGQASHELGPYLQQHGIADQMVHAAVRDRAIAITTRGPKTEAL
jgi:hypothetical protein